MKNIRTKILGALVTYIVPIAITYVIKKFFAKKNKTQIQELPKTN